MEPRGIFSMAVPAEVLAAALAEDGSRRSRPGAVPDYCFTVDGRRMLYDIKRLSFCPSRHWPTVAVASSRGVRLSTGHPSFVRSTRRQLPRSMPGQRPGTDGWGPPSQSEHRRQSISSPRSLRFAAWSSAAPLAGGPGRSASSLLRLRRRQPSNQPSVSGARLAPGRPLHARRAVLHDLDGRRCALRSASPRPLRMPASASRVSSSSGALAAPPAVTHLPRAPSSFISPTAFEQARGGALGAGESGSGSLGAASSESAAGSGRLRACGC